MLSFFYESIAEVAMVGRKLGTVLVAVFVLLTSQAAIADSASLKAQRTTGFAPLAVLFDASATQDSDVASPFHDLVYTFDFGEKRNNPNYDERWGLDGDDFLGRLSKDEYVGAPMAGHVYDKPGNYTASVSVTDPNGNITSASLNITVEDPDTIFSGSKTVCYRSSSSGSFSGCPSGAVQVTSDNFTAIANEASNNKRVLLRRGDIFRGNGVFAPTSGGIIGAFGSGDRPIVQGGNNIQVLMLAGNGLVVMDIDFISSVTSVPAKGTARVIEAEFNENITNGLLYRIKTKYGQGGIGAAGSADHRRQLSIVDSEIGDLANRTDGKEGGKNIDGHFSNAVIMGNLIGKSPTSFNMRIYSNDHTVWSFNKMDGGHHGSKVSVRLQAGGNSGGGDVPTEYFVYSYNTYGVKAFSAGQSKPPSTSFYNVIQNYIVEGNYFYDVNGWKLFGQNASFRNNIKKGSGDDGGGPIATVTKYEMAKCNQGYCKQFPTKNLKIHNNTCYFTANNTRSCINAESDVNASEVESNKNLMYAPSASSETVSTGPLTKANDLFRGAGESSPLVSSSPEKVADYRRIPSVLELDIGADIEGKFKSELGVASVPPLPPSLLSITLQ